MTKKDEEDDDDIRGLKRSVFYFLVIGLPIIVVAIAIFFFVLFRICLIKIEVNGKKRWTCR